MLKPVDYLHVHVDNPWYNYYIFLILFQKFESEMYSRQQILHAIISDGQTMMNNGDVEDKEAFQQKLHLLAAQWQSVVRRANQRKAIIDSTIKQWQAFNDLSEKLREWLADKEEGLQVFTFDSASLQKVKNLVEKAKVCKLEVRSFLLFISKSVNFIYFCSECNILKKKEDSRIDYFLLIGKHTKQLCHLISLDYMALDMRKPVFGVSKSNSNHFFTRMLSICV